MTTDPWWRRVRARSVRARITLSTVVLTGLALFGAGLLVYTLESASIERAVQAQIDQEIAEFTQLAEVGIDPDTGESFADVARLFEVFVDRNVPDDDELLVGYAGRNQEVRTPSRNREIVDDPQFRDLVLDQLDSGGTRRIEDFGWGDLYLTIQPVTVRGSSGAFVIVNFLDDEHEELDGVIRTYALISLLSLGLIAVVANWQAGRLLAPVRTLRETAETISATDLSQRIPETGNDDITDLTRTFNAMVDRLDRAFSSQREFLDDAGHELKTPLTIVSGHLELLDPHDADDVESTRQLVLDEVDRMSRLVHELILLTKTDRPDFLSLGKANLATLTASLVDKCRALGDRHWVNDGAAEYLVTLDDQRITQAVLQLAQNAVKHTQNGDEIGIGSALAPHGEVTLWVRDTGRGVRDEDKHVIFERFGRGRVSPGDEGFGLGLSIVKGIVTAHRGEIAVHDAEPRGARFVITLPADGKDIPPWPGS